MTGRRISIHDYPEHLNPFNELYNDGTDSGHRTKYYTWSSAGKHKIKHAILDKPWSAMSPSKLGRRLSFIKAITIDKLSPNKNKQKVLAVESPTTPPRPSVQYEPFVIISPKQKEKMRRLAQTPSSTTTQDNASPIIRTPSLSRSPEHPIPTARRKLSLQENGTLIDDSSSSLSNRLNSKGHDDSHVATKLSPENEQSCSLTGARPKPRKKRAPPPPPQKSNSHIPSDMESNSSSIEEGDRSVSPDGSITQILEQDATAVHSDTEHHNDNKTQILRID